MTSAENYYFGWMGNDALKTEMIVKWINSYQWEGKWEEKGMRKGIILQH